jgi:uncharacterized protein YchJ
MDYFRDRLTQEELERFVKPVDPANLSQVRRAELIRVGTTTVSPRSRCPCGSGHRFKRCCMYKPNRVIEPTSPKTESLLESNSAICRNKEMPYKMHPLLARKLANYRRRKARRAKA